MENIKETKRRVSLKVIIGSILFLAMIINVAFLGIAVAGAMKQRVLSINDIQADPYAYKGTITITGVVADKSRYKIDPELFLMVETSEAKICKQTGCARFYLPVKYEGKHPTEWDEVNITGEFVEAGGKLFFAATKVEVLRRLSF